MPGVAEALGGRVAEHLVAVLVDHDHSLGRRIERFGEAGAGNFRQLEQSLRFGNDRVDLFDGDVAPARTHRDIPVTRIAR